MKQEQLIFVVSDGVKGALCLLGIALLLIQIHASNSHKTAVALHRKLHWMDLIAFILLFIGVLGHHEPFVFPWQLIALTTSYATTLAYLCAFATGFVIIQSSYQIIALTSRVRNQKGRSMKMPGYYSIIARTIEICYIVVQSVSIILAVATNEIRFFSFRGFTTSFATLVVGSMITYALGLLLIQAKKSAEYSSLERQRRKAKDAKQELNSNERKFAKLADTIDLNDSLNKFGRIYASSTASKNSKNKGESHIEGKDNNANGIASIILSPNNSIRKFRDSPLNSGMQRCRDNSPHNGSHKSRIKHAPGIKSIDLREMRESAASLKKGEAQGTALSKSKRDRIARKEKKKVAARKLMRKMRCTQISSAVLTLVATILAAIVGVIFLTTPGSVRDYYAPNVYDPIYDVGIYVVIGVLYFFVYYSWIHTPDWAICLCQFLRVVDSQ